MRDDDEWVVISHHAGNRWQQWVDSPGYGPVVAWNQGESLNDGHGLYCDEARYHDETQTVLLVASDGPDEPRTMVTVIDAPTAKVSTQRVIEEMGYSTEKRGFPA